MTRRRRGAGFTLIELLVVVAIIAILAAIVFPVLTAVQGNARATKCQSNERELVAAVMMYAQDWENTLPWFQFLTWHDFGGSVAHYPEVRMLQLYEPYVRNFDIIHCTESMKLWNSAKGEWEVRRFAYAYNECFCGPLQVHNKVPSQIKNRCDVWFWDPGKRSRTGRLMGSIPRPSCAALFFCSRPLHPAPGDWGPNGYGWEPEDIANPDRMRNPHKGGTNYAFLDGHVRWAKPAGGGFYQATRGIDYDGNGSVGEEQFMR